MSPETKNRNDSRLLLTVAGLVVAGAVGIALVAGFAVDREADDDARATKRARSTSRPTVSAPALPSRHEVVVEAEEEKLPGSTVEKQDAIEIDPNADFVAVAMRAFEERDFRKAIAHLEAEVDLRPDRAWPQYLLGLSRWKDGELDGAVEAMERAAEIDGSSIKTFVNLSRIHNDRGDFESALEAAEAALAIDESSASALHLKGRSLYNLGRTAEAVETLEQSLAADPGNGYVQNLLGLTLLESGSAYDAIPLLVQAAERLPDVGFVHNNLGMALELDGRKVEAVAAYRRAVEADAGHERATLNLARLEPTLPALETTEPEVHMAVLTPPVEETATAAEVAGESGVSGDEAETAAGESDSSGDPVSPTE
jgi:tetratricopeptide (TPR) repeat protein